MQFGDHILPPLLGKGVTGDSFPQSILVCKRQQYLVAIHQVGNNIRMVDGDGIGTEIKTLSYLFDSGTSHLCPLLGSVSAAFCKKIKQGITFGNDGYSFRELTQRVDTLPLLG